MLGRKGLATQHEYILWRTSASGSVYLRNANQRLILSKAQELIKEYGGITDDARKKFSSWISSCSTLSGGEKAYKNIDDNGSVYRPVSMSAGTPSSDPRYYVPLVHPVTKKDCPVPPTGWSRPPETFAKLREEGLLIFGRDHTTLPQLKLFMTEDSRRQASTVIQDTGRGKTDMQNLGLEFPYCHPLSLYVEILGAASDPNDAVILDFFAGSGTNGHAVINLNREEGTSRKYVLVEVGSHFDTILKPRIQKAIYSKDWKDGKATAPQTGVSNAFKVLKLESYEDTLNNLQMADDKKRQTALEVSFKLREAYYLNYLLQMETQGSPSLLNISAFNDPTAYQLNIKSAGSDAQVSQAVDLLETFNWLIGLRVKKLHAPTRFNANLAREADPDLPAGSTTRLCLKGKLQEDPNGTWWFRSVEGLVKNTGGSQREQRVLIVWRKLTGDLEQDNTVLAAYLAEYHIIDVQKSTLEVPYDVIYINGSHNLPMLAQCDIRLLEDTFHQKMWDVKDV
jgi:adenine-specific DNA-methyltransferase